MSQARIVTRVVRSVRWAFVESLLSAGASLATIIIVARLLPPAEFGRAGIAIAVSAIVQAALLAGMPDALVRAPSTHTRLTDAAFWATLAIGGGAALLSALAGLGVAVVGHDGRLGALIAVQGLTGIALGAAAVPTGLLLRKMRTRALVRRTAASKLAGLAVSAALALTGWGAWALVIGNIAAQTTAAVQMLTTMRRPHWGARDPALAPTLCIGLLSGVQASLGTLTTRGFVLAFGAAYGPHAVGLFNFALRLVEESAGLVITTLRRVTVTSFAAAKRQGIDLQPLFMRGTHSIAFIAAPLFLGIAAVAGDAVPWLFGAQWSGAVPALQLMLGMWVLRATRMLVNAIMLVDGRQRAMVAFGFAGLVATGLAFAASLPFGAAATTWAYAATLVGVIFGGAAFRRQTGIGAVEQIAAGARPIIAALVMAMAVIALRTGPLAMVDIPVRLTLAVAAGFMLYGALVLAFDRAGLRRALALLRR